MLSVLLRSTAARYLLLGLAGIGVLSGVYFYGYFKGQRECAIKINNETVDTLRSYEKISREVEKDVQTKTKSAVVDELRSSGWLRPDSEIN